MLCGAVWCGVVLVEWRAWPSARLKQQRIFDSAVQCMYSGVLCGGATGA
jgi:hypothetical protein